MDSNHSSTNTLELAGKIDTQGRTLIPKAFRQRLGVGLGDDIVMRFEDDKLIIESRAALLARVQARYAGSDKSLVDELIAERREEAKRETAEIESASSMATEKRKK